MVDLERFIGVARTAPIPSHGVARKAPIPRYFAGPPADRDDARETGASRVRYFVGSTGQPLAEQRVGGAAGDAWVWLLRDAKGSVATELRDNGVIVGQKAYDPYGAPDKGGSSKTQGERHSTLGFQAAHTDDVSGRILLGERQ